MNKYMKVAIESAREGIQNNHGGPFGSVITKDGDIISVGHNRVVENNDPTCHGEIDAIRSACKKLNTFDLSGCELYTTSQPCPMCECAIRWANIDKVYYGCSVQDAEDIGFRDNIFANSSIKGIQIDRNECLKVFEEYMKLQHISY